MLKNVKKEKNAFTRIVQDKISASLFYRKIKKMPEFHENIEWSIEEKVNNKKIPEFHENIEWSIEEKVNNKNPQQEAGKILVILGHHKNLVKI